MPNGRRRLRDMLVLLAVLCAGESCRRDNQGETADDSVRADAAGRKQADVLVFPEELHVADAAVNDFVARAMSICGRGDYDSFRLLWSAREDPLSRDEFEEGWQAVQTIRVRALKKVLLVREEALDATETDTVYVILTEVHLDPMHRAGRREPQREVTLMLVKEHEEWRLGRAPKKMRSWIKELVQAGASEDADPDAAAGTDAADEADAGGGDG